MADEIDITNDQQQFLLEKKISEIRKGSGSSLPKIGRCHYCSEQVSDDQAFCDSECASDYQQMKAFRG